MAGVFAIVSMLLLLLLLMAFSATASVAVATTGAAGSSCTRSCGNVSIPYPFGVETGCYHTGGFNLTCITRGHGPPKLFLGDGTVQVLEISAEHSTVRINSTSEVPFDDSGRTTSRTWGLGIPESGPYFLSESTNILKAIGCNIQVSILGGVNKSLLVSSCSAICPVLTPDSGFMGNGSCTGIGCCQVSIVLGYPRYTIQTKWLSEFQGLPLGAVYISDRSFDYTSDMMFGIGPKAFPATLDWIINNSTCPANETIAPECRSAHSYCQDSSSAVHEGYLCRCSKGYEGNPYVTGGCQDIDECKNSSKSYPCYGDCKNTPGSYVCLCHNGFKGNASVPNGCQDINECDNPKAHSCYGTCKNSIGSFQCQCPNGTYGNPQTKDGCIINRKNLFTGLSIGLGVGGGTSLLLALGAPFIARKIKLQKVKKMREKFFNQNHGLLLQQLMSHNVDIGQRMIITLRDLEKATNNFDRARVIGGGGHGIVFKGIIDLQVVAIKKSKIVVQREICDFINEVAVLSQVNHRNVVKLLGCCLEAEVPLLIYEFISNGTLHQHLHVEGPISLPWAGRIRIALEVARALSYLHSAASMPIFHRDIKSTNILLDDRLAAKVSDFGASRYIPTDQTGITTAVQGTIGYLDPMYYYTGRLTDKSDVFSFGVLLIELLTRKQPFLYRSNGDDDSLVSHFIKLLAQGNIFDIIDPQVMEEEAGEVIEIATLASACTKLRGEDRPTMREVEMKLENSLAKKQQYTPCIAAQRTNDDETLVQYKIEHITNEASRQYTMEEEILLSASYPR